ncbi:MAG: hypothetical protein KC550_02890 [Nanoarchaeota archaeon]|nr:hypothetical protein [Nanoarchaeota archaeon]
MNEKLEFPEWDYDCEDYNKKSTIKVNQFNGQNTKWLNMYEKKFGTMTGILSRSISRFSSKKVNLEKRTKRFGRINNSYLANELANIHSGRDPSQKIYDRRVNAQRELYKNGIVLGLLLDQSGSTRFDVNDDLTRIDLIKSSALSIGQSISKIGDSFFVYFYHTHRRSNPTIMEEILREDEVWSENIEKKIAALEETSDTEYFNNKDGVAIRFMNEKLLTSPFQNKYLFILTDGTPNCDNDYYQDEYAFEDTKKALEEGKEKEIKNIYLTINPKSEAKEFMEFIRSQIRFGKVYTKMEDIVCGLTEVYEMIKEKRI